jgi:hypothetical protein
MRATDPFFTVHHRRPDPPGSPWWRVELRRKDLAAAIKAAAVEAGLPPRFFSTSSLRKTHACKAGKLGPVGLAEAAHRAGWATDAAGQSATVARFYNITESASALPPVAAPAPPPGYLEADRPRIPLDVVRGLLPPGVAPAPVASVADEAPAPVSAPRPRQRPRPPSPRRSAPKRPVFYPAVGTPPPKKKRLPTKYVHR